MASRPKRARKATAKLRNNANACLLDTSIEESSLKPEKTNFHDVNVQRFHSSCNAQEWNTIMGSYPTHLVGYNVKVPLTFSSVGKLLKCGYKSLKCGCLAHECPISR